MGTCELAGQDGRQSPRTGLPGHGACGRSSQGAAAVTTVAARATVGRAGSARRTAAPRAVAIAPLNRKGPTAAVRPAEAAAPAGAGQSTDGPRRHAPVEGSAFTAGRQSRRELAARLSCNAGAALSESLVGKEAGQPRGYIRQRYKRDAGPRCHSRRGPARDPPPLPPEPGAWALRITVASGPPPEGGGP